MSEANVMHWHRPRTRVPSAGFGRTVQVLGCDMGVTDGRATPWYRILRFTGDQWKNEWSAYDKGEREWHQTKAPQL